MLLWVEVKDSCLLSRLSGLPSWGFNASESTQVLVLTASVRALQLEVDQYGYAVVKSGVEEEEEDERTSGQEWRRQPWYSDEPFFDFLEIPKPAPELTLDHEKEFLLQGVWAAAANTPWIGDEGEITDPETKKVSATVHGRAG